MRFFNINLLPRRVSAKVLSIIFLAVLTVCSLIIYKTHKSNLDYLNYLTVRQAQSSSGGTSSLLKEFDKEIHSNLLLQSFLFLLVLVALIICFLFLALYQIINRRLYSLSQHFCNAAKPDGQIVLEPVSAEGSDELASLAKSFNQLIDKLRPTYKTLKEEIQQQARSIEDLKAQRLREINLRRKAEQDLLLRQFIIDHAGEAFFLTGHKGRILEVNELACKSLGYSRQELLTMFVSDIDPHITPETWSKHWKTLQQKNHVLIETEHRRKDGTVFPIEVSLTHFEFNGHEYHCAFVRDLTKQKKQEQENLQETHIIQVQQQALLRISTLPAQINGDLETVALHLTETAARLLQVRRCSIWLLQDNDTQLRCVDIYDAQTRQHSSNFLLKTENYPDYIKALQSGRVIDASDAWRDPRARELHDSYLRPQGILSMLDATIRFSGKVIGVLSCETVETKRIWTDLEIRFAGELADQVSLTLLNRSYRQSERQARQIARSAVNANQAKSNFLASMSHEIRTPMNAILGFVDILAQEPLTEEQHSYLKVIQNSATNLLTLLNDILDFSKIEAGKIKVEFADCHLPSLLEDLDSMMRPMASRKNLAFEVLQCRELPEHILTDSVRLRQCLTNLLSNAIKFTEKGHVYLNVSCLEKDKTPWIQFAIEDTGIGIASDQQSAIFESYCQADNRSIQESRGVGLGLAITKNLTSLLGGQLSLTSMPGNGSVFTLLLPIQPASSGQQKLWNKYDAACMTQQTETSAETRLCGHVLVVEDNPSNQILISMLLKKIGLEVTLANDGAEGVEEAHRQKYDLILMDMQMPRMNGYQAAEKLRAEGFSTPIIAVTANAMKGDEEKCLQAGCDGYLSKPVDRKKLYKILRRYLSVVEKAKTLPLAKAAAAQPTADSIQTQE